MSRFSKSGIITVVNEVEDFTRIMSVLNDFLLEALSEVEAEGRVSRVVYDVEEDMNYVKIYIGRMLNKVNVAATREVLDRFKRLRGLLEKYSGAEVYRFDIEYYKNDHDLSRYCVKLHHGKMRNRQNIWFEMYDMRRY